MTNRLDQLKPYRGNDQVRFPMKVISDLQIGLTTHGWRIVLAIIHGVKEEDDLFPAWEVKAEKFVKYIGQSNRSLSNRLKTVEAGLDDINNHPATLRDGYSFRKIPWFTDYAYNHKEKLVTFELNAKIKPFILGAKQWIPFLLETAVMKFKGKYTHALYLKTRMYESYKAGKNRGVIELYIEDLITYFQLNNKKAFSGSSKNTNFLNSVLGITKPKGSEKWIYITESRRKRKDGSKISVTLALEEINIHSDVIIDAEPLKNGNSYDRIKFTVRLKKNIEDIENLEQMLIESNEIIPERLKISDKSTRVGAKKEMTFTYGAVAMNLGIKGANENTVPRELSKKDHEWLKTTAEANGYKWNAKGYFSKFYSEQKKKIEIS